MCVCVRGHEIALAALQDDRDCMGRAEGMLAKRFRPTLRGQGTRLGDHIGNARLEADERELHGSRDRDVDGTV